MQKKATGAIVPLFDLNCNKRFDAYWVRFEYGKSEAEIRIKSQYKNRIDSLEKLEALIKQCRTFKPVEVMKSLEIRQSNEWDVWVYVKATKEKHYFLNLEFQPITQLEFFYNDQVEDEVVN